jgi:hypothetical protein
MHSCFENRVGVTTIKREGVCYNERGVGVKTDMAAEYILVEILIIASM